jgi:hypothetical protein
VTAAKSLAQAVVVAIQASAETTALLLVKLMLDNCRC